MESKIKLNNLRNSNIEILRIISMLLIISHHYSVHGFEETKLYYSFNKYIVDVLFAGGKIGVSCFILISGYYMINSKFTIKKLWKIIGEMFFYSFGVLLLFAFVITPNYKFSNVEIRKAILPYIYSAYGFLTCYIILMILAEYINIFIKNMSREILKKFIVITCLLWSFITFFFKANLYFSDMIWYVVLYCISAYIKLYINFNDALLKKNLLILVFSSISLILLIIVFNIIGYYFNISFFINNIRYLACINSPFVLIIAISLFIYFASKELYYNTYINELSKCTLGVYLLHDNYILRPYLWKIILKNEEYYYSKYLIIHSITSIFFIFVMCSIIDYIRIKVIEPYWIKIYDFFYYKIKLILKII